MRLQLLDRIKIWLGWPKDHYAHLILEEYKEREEVKAREIMQLEKTKREMERFTTLHPQQMIQAAVTEEQRKARQRQRRLKEKRRNRGYF